MQNLWKTEPVVILGVVEAVVLLAVSYGAPIDAKQQILILGVVKAALTWLARSRVSPVEPK